MTQETELTPKDLRVLYKGNFISRADYLKFLSPSPSQWQIWAAKNFMFLGAVLVLAGVVCFFAYNWENLGNIFKLGIPFASFIFLGAAAVWKGLDNIPGKVLSTAAAFMIGVFMAVFGQVYQTGADAWQLFFNWAILMLPLAVLTKFTGLWALFAVVLNIFVYLYPWSVFGISRSFPLPALVNIIFFCLAEYFAKYGIFKEPYFKFLAYMAALIPLAFSTGFLSSTFEKFMLMDFPFWFFSAAGIYYLVKTKQMISLIGLTAAAVAAIAITYLYRYLFNFNSAEELLLLAIITCVIFGLAGYGVMLANKHIRGTK